MHLWESDLVCVSMITFLLVAIHVAFAQALVFDGGCVFLFASLLANGNHEPRLCPDL
jgi:hypothetical protein